MNKKYDDSKKAYFKSKEERERLRQEVERFKSDGVKESEVSGSTEVSNKYEQIKIKYRVSKSISPICYILSFQLIEDKMQSAEKRVAQLENDSKNQADQ